MCAVLPCFCRIAIFVASSFSLTTAIAEILTFAGPAMGTTYRVHLAHPIEGRSLGEIHRDVDRLLAQLDVSLSTWRADSDVSRLNRTAAGIWLPVNDDLWEVLVIAKRLHRQTNGRFDVTVAPLIKWWAEQERTGIVDRCDNTPPVPPEILQSTGINQIELQEPATDRPAAVRKQNSRTAIDLNSIGPGFAVDKIGDLLLALGSSDHLVELGGEVRAWGDSPDGNGWLVRLRYKESSSTKPHFIRLTAGEAVAIAACLPQSPIVDPRTGSRIKHACPRAPAIILSPTCAEADALATVSLIPE